jgi:DNA-binding response OmpR family regulator
LKRKNIIVVDDELLIRDLLYDFFSERDWGVAVYDSGENALEAARTKKYDIVLVDIKMPEVDGISLVTKIKKLYPQLPVVIMTAFPSVETAVEALRLKVDDYIIKPFNINKLFKTLDGIVDESWKKAEAVKSENVLPG